LTDFDNFWYN